MKVSLLARIRSYWLTYVSAIWFQDGDIFDGGTATVIPTDIADGGSATVTPTDIANGGDST